MDPEQSAQDSDHALIGRMASVLSPEAEQPAPQVAAPEVESPMGDQPEDEQEAPANAEPELADFEDDDGTVYKIPAALKDKIPLRADYTRKTQQAATLAESANDRLQYAEAREQFSSAVMSEVAELRSKQYRLQQLKSIDLDALGASDSAAERRIERQISNLEREIGIGEQSIRNSAAQLAAMTDEHNSKQWKIASDGFISRVGSITPRINQEMENRAIELGFTKKELSTRYADARILELIHDSTLFKQIKAGKTAALETARKAPPVVKPGATNANPSADKEKALRANLKKSGDFRDAARLLLFRGK